MNTLKPECPVCRNCDPDKIHLVETNAHVKRIQCGLCGSIYFDREPPYTPSYCPKYNLHFFRPGDIRKAGIMAAELAELVSTRFIGPRILEAGTGNGLTVFLLNQMEIYAEGIDVDPKWCAVLNARLGIKINSGFFEDFKPDEPFSLIYSSHVLEHTPSPKLFLKNALDCIVPGGLLVLETPAVEYIGKTDGRWHHFQTRDPYEHRILFSKKGLSALALSVGFKPLSIDLKDDFQCLRMVAEVPR